LCLLLLSSAFLSGAITVEIKGKVTNALTEQQYRSVEITVTDRLGVVLGRAHPNARGNYELKVNAPQYILLKADLSGFSQVIYQLDTSEQKESTTDREENRVFGELRIPVYYQNITFGDQAAARPQSLDDLLAGENPAAVKAYQAARSQRQAGDFRGATSALEKLVRQYPGFYLGYIELGMTLAGQQENDRALEIFAQAQKLRPEHPWAYVGLGMALNGKKDYGAAAPYLIKAVELDPNSIHAQFELGQASFQLGEAGRAIECFQRVIELDPAFNPLAYKTLAAIYVKQQDGQRAAQALESYLVHFPDAADAEKVRQILGKLKR
jgi:tetratricopeptide (TPR) repeat protein